MLRLCCYACAAFPHYNHRGFDTFIKKENELFILPRVIYESDLVLRQTVQQPAVIAYWQLGSRVSQGRSSGSNSRSICHAHLYYYEDQSLHYPGRGSKKYISFFFTHYATYMLYTHSIFHRKCTLLFQIKIIVLFCQIVVKKCYYEHDFFWSFQSYFVAFFHIFFISHFNLYILMDILFIRYQAILIQHTFICMV